MNKEKRKMLDEVKPRIEHCRKLSFNQDDRYKDDDLMNRTFNRIRTHSQVMAAQVNLVLELEKESYYGVPIQAGPNVKKNIEFNIKHLKKLMDQIMSLQMMTEARQIDRQIFKDMIYEIRIIQQI